MAVQTVSSEISSDLAVVAGDLHHILRQWHTSPTAALQANLSIFRDYGEPRATTQVRDLVLKLLDNLDVRNPAAADLLRQRFFDNEVAYVLANRLNVSESIVFRRQREALIALAEITWAEEQKVRRQQAQKTLERLPDSTYHTLFGVERPYRRLESVLTQAGLPWLIAVDGLGGIGKTSLVDYLVRNVSLMGDYVDVVWISARRHSLALSGQIVKSDEPAMHGHELLDQLVDILDLPLARPFGPEHALSALRERFAKPHIIVIDNMETVIDYQSILPTLRKLVNPSKVIITSRHSLGDEAGVHCTSLSELKLADATALLKSEAEVRGIDVLLDAPPAVYEEIYQTVGGNPLALKIVTGLVRVRDIPAVLADLREGRAGRADALYTYIYREAWDVLSEAARHALLAMPLVVGDGGTLSHLAAITGLAPDELSKALEELIAHSLISVGGTLEERRYHIHGLTETFLQNEVAKWL
ncbi:MAG: NB-ARC domain-containing protein [Anaerolineae bacterium]